MVESNSGNYRRTGANNKTVGKESRPSKILNNRLMLMPTIAYIKGYMKWHAHFSF